MSVIESPNIYDRPGPNGTFAIVQLDPVASVAALNDARATAAAAKIPRSKYLVIIETLGYSRLELALGLPKLDYSYLAVGRGLPHLDWAAVGVSPACAQREDRPPMVPSSPLPWSDCYIHTIDCFAAVVSRLHKPKAEVVHLTEDDLEMAGYYMLADQIREGQEAQDAQELRPAGTDSRTGQSQTSGSSSDVDELSEAAESQNADLDDSDWDSESEPSPPPLPSPPAPYQPQQMNLHVEMWLDLTAGDDICPPQQIESDIAQLRSIEDEWAYRMAEEIVTKRGKTATWLESVETGEEPPDDASIRAISDDGLGDDWDVAAEDAIDDRAERARAERRTRRAERQTSRQDLQPYNQSLYDDEVEDDDEDEDNSEASGDEDQPEAEPNRPSRYVLYGRIYMYVRAGIRRAWTALRQFVFFCGSEPKDGL